jgi:hypothetical protein
LVGSGNEDPEEDATGAEQILHRDGAFSNEYTGMGFAGVVGFFLIVEYDRVV